MLGRRFGSLSRRGAIKVGIGVGVAIPGTAPIGYARDNLGAAWGRLPDDALRRRMVEFYDAL